MFLSALALAAMLQAPSSGVLHDGVASAARPAGAVSPRPSTGFVIGPQARGCKRTAPELVGKPDALTAQPLTKMPMAHGEWAVARLVDGCPVAVPIVRRAPAR